MSDNIFDYFCDANELRSREPEYFVPGPHIVIDAEGSGPHNVPMVVGEGNAAGDVQPAAAGLVKTFVTILDEGCKKCLSEPPQYTFSVIPDSLDQFVTQCQLGSISACGMAKTKKASKQLAAKEVLLKLADADRHQDYGLGPDKEAAKRFLNSLMPEIYGNEENAETAQTENWVGKINEMCQKLKLQAPQYDVDNSAATGSQPPVFTAKCLVCKMTTIGKGRTKKAAKTAAAQEMFAKLKDVEPMSRAGEALIGVPDDKEAPAATEAVKVSSQTASSAAAAQSSRSEAAPVEPQKPVEQSSDALKKIREALSSSSKSKALQELLDAGDADIERVFRKQTLEFTIFSRRDTDDNVQCLLQLHGKDGEESVFPGTGASNSDCCDQACHNALVHLEAFVGQH